MTRLWELLAPAIESGQEARKIDLKQTLDLSTRAGRREFAKDVAAMANTRGGPGYLVIGVVDGRHRRDGPGEHVLGFQPQARETFEQWMVQALENHCAPVPDTRFETFTHPGTGRTVGVIVVPRGYDRPYLADGKVYLRRGTHTRQVSDTEVATTDPRVLVNFTRPLNSAQIETIKALLGADIDEVIDVPGILDETIAFPPQIRGIIERVGLTPAEWQSLPIVVNIHGLAPAAASILAWMHGLRGHFPSIVRMARRPNSDQFEVREILDLQSVRNEVRDWSVQP